jgi:hypothetical protein
MAIWHFLMLATKVVAASNTTQHIRKELKQLRCE